MDSIEVVLFFDQPRYDAVNEILHKNGTNVDTELKNYFVTLYEQLLSAEQRADVETQIERELKQERLEAEARKRFGVFHIRENGIDSFFRDEVFTSFSSVGYQYRQYERHELSSDPDSFADVFIRSEDISENQFHIYETEFSNDPRILTLMDFDLDAGTVSVMQKGHEDMLTYNLHDVSVAAYKAFRGDRSPARTATAFSEALIGKEIEIAPEIPLSMQ